MTMMPRVPGPVPRAIVVHLKFNQAAVTSSANTVGAGQVTEKIFNTNSIFDPDAGATGNQPRFHDQWSAIYRKYYVRRFTIRCRMHNTTQSNAAGGYIFTEQRSSNDLAKLNPAIQTTAGMTESAKSDKLCTVSRFRSPASGQTYWKVFTKSMVPAWVLEGRDKQTNMTSLFGQNPATLTEFRILWNFPQAGGVISQWYEYEVDYEVCLFDPIMPGAS